MTPHRSTSATMGPMSPWSRELAQIAGATVAALGLALIVLAFHGPLVAGGVALALVGLLGVAVGYVGLQGPPPPFVDDETPVDPVQQLLERTRRESDV